MQLLLSHIQAHLICLPFPFLERNAAWAWLGASLSSSFMNRGHGDQYHRPAAWRLGPSLSLVAFVLRSQQFFFWLVPQADLQEEWTSYASRCWTGSMSVTTQSCWRGCRFDQAAQTLPQALSSCCTWPALFLRCSWSQDWGSLLAPSSPCYGRKQQCLDLQRSSRVPLVSTLLDVGSYSGTSWLCSSNHVPFRILLL